MLSATHSGHLLARFHGECSAAGRSGQRAREAVGGGPSSWSGVSQARGTAWGAVRAARGQHARWLLAGDLEGERFVEVAQLAHAAPLGSLQARHSDLQPPRQRVLDTQPHTHLAVAGERRVATVARTLAEADHLDRYALEQGRPFVDDADSAVEEIVGERRGDRRAEADRASVPAAVLAPPALRLVALVPLVNLAIRAHDAVAGAVGKGVLPAAPGLGIDLAPGLQAAGRLARSVEQLPDRVGLLEPLVAQTRRRGGRGRGGGATHQPGEQEHGKHEQPSLPGGRLPRGMGSPAWGYG